MSHNTFGHLFRVTTWGESHGPALGCVVDGVPPGILLTAEMIQGFLDKRRPGNGKFVTQRQEPDAVRILSGVFEDERTGGQRTTGTPISLMIENTDQRSKDYGEIAQAFRPGHADYPYFAKYGVRDYRGGGRSSARETAARVAAGAVARLVIPGVTVRAALVQIGPHKIDRANWDWAQTEENPYWSPDAAIIPVWEEHLEKIRKAGSSTGAVVEVEATGVPAGWGAPLYGKLDAELAAALMSINAAKGVEIGEGFDSAALTGEDNADMMRLGPNGEPEFLSNHAGGVLGGLSTGQPVVARVAFKPTSSILIPRQTLNEAGEEIDLRTKGRHDPCVGIRGVPVVEAMTACVLADAFLRHRAQTGGGAFLPGGGGERV
ncbi:chorismate synthase [Caulobacter flavus]|uniref:Chorismate synthase n=1 Tax=Caulobacter flavus TaxID=1679497 RepID=A0A2N5CNK4_9CAUL|nr:chorismate synthase [Caulobacter flavus]AYV49335.1 chorismate synthase [Caulobacter flavus]PLR08088.1 chorismate synthase [Caulobacter flavus]